MDDCCACSFTRPSAEATFPAVSPHPLCCNPRKRGSDGGVLSPNGIGLPSDCAWYRAWYRPLSRSQGCCVTLCLQRYRHQHESVSRSLQVASPFNFAYCWSCLYAPKAPRDSLFPRSERKRGSRPTTPARCLQLQQRLWPHLPVHNPMFQGNIQSIEVSHIIQGCNNGLHSSGSRFGRDCLSLSLHHSDH